MIIDGAAIAKQIQAEIKREIQQISRKKAVPFRYFGRRPSPLPDLCEEKN